MRRISTFQKAVSDNKSLSVFTDEEWRFYCDWAQWMAGPITQNPTQKQIDELETHVVKIKAECARRGMAF